MIHTEPQTPYTPTTGTVTARTIEVTWTPLSTSTETGDSVITSYALYYATSPYTTWTTVKGVATNDTTTDVVVTGLVPNTAYKFKV